MSLIVRPMMRRSIILLCLCGALFIAACGDAREDKDDGTIRVVTSMEIFADMVRNVGGDRVTVEALLPSGADVHTYELAPGKAADVARADIVFLNGLGFEEAIGDVVRGAAKGPVVELTAGLETIRGENPHLWLDVQLAARYVERIRDELIRIDEDGRLAYEANAAGYLDQLRQLDAEIEAGVETIPAANRRLVTFHDAYPYLAERYGLEIVAVVAPSPGQEPSAQDIADLVDAIGGVPAVFKEPQFNAEVLELAAGDADVQVLELLSDAYVDGVDSYIDLMRFNLSQLLEGLRSE